MKEKTRNSLIFLMLLLTFLIWSNSFIAIKILLARMGAMDLVKLRFLPVGLISITIILLFYRRQAGAIIREHPVRTIFSGLLSVTLYNLLLNSGMHYVEPNAASLLIALNPLITLLLAVRFLGEKMTARRLVGTLITFAGLVLVVLLGRVGESSGTFISFEKIPFALMVLGAPLSWAACTVIVKPVLKKHSPVIFNFLSLTVGSLPLIFLVDRPFFNLVKSLSLKEIGASAFLSLACTILAFGLWNIAIRHWHVSSVSLFVYLNPPLTAVFSYLFFGTGITAFFFIGGSVMLSGILLATLAGKNKFRANLLPDLVHAQELQTHRQAGLHRDD